MSPLVPLMSAPVRPPTGLGWCGPSLLPPPAVSCTCTICHTHIHRPALGQLGVQPFRACLLQCPAVGPSRMYRIQIKCVKLKGVRVNLEMHIGTRLWRAGPPCRWAGLVIAPWCGGPSVASREQGKLSLHVHIFGPISPPPYTRSCTSTHTRSQRKRRARPAAMHNRSRGGGHSE